MSKVGKAQEILLGYEVGTGKPVSIPLRNIAVTGQTQESGKTTTLEALAARTDARVLTFVTKRGEKSFANGRRVQPYFRDRADWFFVDQIIEAAMKEKNKWLRQFLIPICRTTQTLKDVQVAIRKELKKTTGGQKHGALTQLDAYLERIVPEIQRAKLASALDLQPGLNVMDVSDFTTPMQMLFVQSAIDWINDRERDTVVVIPEAWEFIPEGKGSPVKDSAIALVRKGSGIGNRIWVDSQDMAGVDKTILRGCPVWLVGTQREVNEIKRNLANIPPPAGKLTVQDIRALERGFFFASFGSTLVKVYVRPSWMGEEEAIKIARGTQSVEAAHPPAPRAPTAPMAAAAAKTVDEILDTVEAARTEGFQKGQELGHREGFVLGRQSAFAEVTKEFGPVLGSFIAGAVTDWAAMKGGLAVEAPPIQPAIKPMFQNATEAAAAVAEKTRALTFVTTAPPCPAKRAAARPAAPAGAADGQKNYAGALRLLDVLVISHPHPLTAELWAAFADTSAAGGWWNKQIKWLRDEILIESSSEGYRVTPAGLARSGETPQHPKNEVELWYLWRTRIGIIIGSGAHSLLAPLAAHRDYSFTTEQWGLLANRSPSGGWWNSNSKPLREWGLVDSVGGRTRITAKGAAIDHTPPSTTPAADVLRAARIANLSPAGNRLYEALNGAMTREQLSESAGIARTGGYWNTALSDLLASGLVEERGNTIVKADEVLT